MTLMREVYRHMVTTGRGHIYTSNRFFRPLPDFIPWLLQRFPDQPFIDFGCGLGHLTQELRAAGATCYPVDFFPSPDAVVPDIIPLAAEFFPLTPGVLPLLARPSGGYWIYDTMEHAIADCGRLLYLGVPRNYDRDLRDLPWNVHCLREPVGEEEEGAWLISLLPEEPQ